MKTQLLSAVFLLSVSSMAFAEGNDQNIVAPETHIQASAPKPEAPLVLGDDYSLPKDASKELIAQKNKLTAAQNNLDKVQQNLSTSIRQIQFEGGAPIATESLRQSLDSYDQALQTVEQAESSFIDEKLHFIDSKEENFAGTN